MEQRGQPEATTTVASNGGDLDPLGPIERILFANVPLWVMLFAILLGLLFTIAMLVAAHEGPGKAGMLGTLAQNLGETPRAIKSLVPSYNFESTMRTRDPAPALPPGFGAREPGFQDPGYLLIARGDPQLNRSVVELVRVRDGAVLRRYAPDIAAVNARSLKSGVLAALPGEAQPSRYRMTHPLLLDDGSIIFHGDSPLARVDACGKLMWTVDGIFTHAIEPDGAGGFWVSVTYPHTRLPFVGRDFEEQGIARVSYDGKLLTNTSIAKILQDNGLYHLWGPRAYAKDPFHINDVQPVPSDGKHWRAGDLFISLRHLSMVMLYRPSTGRIVWYRIGPWMMQHDVDILDDHRISIFNNNTLGGEESDYGAVRRVQDHNNLLIYDFDTDRVSAPFDAAFGRYQVKTFREGLATLLPNGDAFVEETVFGRLLRVTPSGGLRWQYINADAKRRRYLLNWSRYLDPRQFGKAIQAAVTAKCG